jgi:Uma2 family endonuclease
MSVDEFLDWASATDGRWQLVDGVPYAMAPAGVIHGALQSELGSLIRNHLHASGSACTTIIAPGVIPRFLAEHNMRVPDIAVTCTPFGRGARALMEPVLIVEILSPSNQAATWANVWAYTSIPSMRDILVLRSDRMEASLLRRQPDGTWPDRPAEMSEGSLSPESIGLTVPLVDVYATTGLSLN